MGRTTRRLRSGNYYLRKGFEDILLHSLSDVCGLALAFDLPAALAQLMSILGNFRLRKASFALFRSGVADLNEIEFCGESLAVKRLALLMREAERKECLPIIEPHLLSCFDVLTCKHANSVYCVAEKCFGIAVRIWWSLMVNVTELVPDESAIKSLSWNIVSMDLV
jgi:hypothetical protein